MKKVFVLLVAVGLILGQAIGFNINAADKDLEDIPPATVTVPLG